MKNIFKKLPKQTSKKKKINKENKKNKQKIKQRKQSKQCIKTNRYDTATPLQALLKFKNNKLPNFEKIEHVVTLGVLTISLVRKFKQKN